MIIKNKKIFALVITGAFLVFLAFFLATPKGCQKVSPAFSKNTPVVHEKTDPGKSIREKMSKCSGLTNQTNLMDIEQTATFVSDVCGVHLNADHLVYLSRLVYFEIAFGVEEEMSRSAEAVAAVILNRYLYDLDHGTDYFDGQGGIFSVSIQNSGRKTKNGIRGWQFSSFAFFPEYFYATRDMSGKHTVRTLKMSAQKSEVAYRSLIRVLTGQVKDPVCGAVFYKNSAATNKLNKKEIIWNHQPAGLGSGTYMQWTGEIEGCPKIIEGHHYYRVYQK